MGLTHITIAGEIMCQGEGCPECARSQQMQVDKAVEVLRAAGWIVRPPCVECSPAYPCRMTTDPDNLGECALAKMEGP